MSDEPKRTWKGYVMASPGGLPETDPLFGLDERGSAMPGVYLSPRRPPKPTKPFAPGAPHKSAGQPPEEPPASSPDPCDLLALTTGGIFFSPSSSAAVLERGERERSTAPFKFSPSSAQPGSPPSATAGCVQRARRWACWLPATFRGPAPVSWLLLLFFFLFFFPPRVLPSVCASQRLLLLNPALPAAVAPLLARIMAHHNTKHSCMRP